jgi:hypothetical protein
VSGDLGHGYVFGVQLAEAVRETIHSALFLLLLLGGGEIKGALLTATPKDVSD